MPVILLVFMCAYGTGEPNQQTVVKPQAVLSAVVPALPVKGYEDEAKVVHRKVVGMLQSQPAVLFGSSAEPTAAAAKSLLRAIAGVPGCVDEDTSLKLQEILSH